MPRALTEETIQARYKMLDEAGGDVLVVAGRLGVGRDYLNRFFSVYPRVVCLVKKPSCYPPTAFGSGCSGLVGNLARGVG